jgi:uncharacterized protein YajQ (UPF0234 family)
MAKDSSFDVVSQVDMQEIDNAVQQASREVLTRYDLKDSGSSVTFEKDPPGITVTAPSDFVSKQVIDIVNSKLVRRNVDLKAVRWSAPETASGGTVRISGSVINGIDQEIARKINKDIKDKKLKVKVQIEGDKLRVSSAKKDLLQEVIAFLKQQDYGIPLQYVNYR